MVNGEPPQAAAPAPAAAGPAPGSGAPPGSVAGGRGDAAAGAAPGPGPASAPDPVSAGAGAAAKDQPEALFPADALPTGPAGGSDAGESGCGGPAAGAAARDGRDGRDAAVPDGAGGNQVRDHVRALLPDDPDDAAELVARVALSRLAEPGDAVVGHWLAVLGPVELLRALRDRTPLPRMGRERQDRIRARLPGLDPLGDLATAHAAGARFIRPGTLEWPSQLDDLGELRPYGLWVRGSADLRRWALRSVAVVGARACTDYGRHVAGGLGTDLAAAGWTVVSGAAYGIDAAAHRGALAAAGATVAVLACGVDRAYPPRNEQLIARIGHDGLVVAELAPGTAPNRGRFVLRNRVIAALTRGTVVVEAEHRSGALVTARRARELNRHLMAVPGPVTSGLSDGTHRLVREGAVLVTSAAEIGEQVGAVGADLAPEPRTPPLQRELLDPATADVLEAVPGGAGGPVEAVVAETGRDSLDVLQRLHELVALGFVERDGACWRIRRGQSLACSDRRTSGPSRRDTTQSRAGRASAYRKPR